MGKPVAMLDNALKELGQLPQCRLLEVSRYYRTPPWGEPDQPDFINAVARIETRLSAGDLLAQMLALETRLGRRRTQKRWGPRLIDLDLLLCDNCGQINRPGLIVPHPRMAERAFVLVPLAELAPGLVVPGQGRVDELLNRLDRAERDAVRPLPRRPDNAHKQGDFS